MANKVPLPCKRNPNGFLSRPAQASHVTLLTSNWFSDTTDLVYSIADWRRLIERDRKKMIFHLVERWSGRCSS